MDHLHRVAILLMVAAIPAAAPPASSPAPEFCFAAGSFNYRVSSTASSPDLRVKIDLRASNPDLRVEVSDDIATADFALVDDASAAPGGGCPAAGSEKTVRLVADSHPADLTVALSSEPADGSIRLYVHSAWFGPEHAAAVYAAMHQFEHTGLPSAAEVEDQNASW